MTIRNRASMDEILCDIFRDVVVGHGQELTPSPRHGWFLDQ
ncbi:MAG: hypothetical protein Nkreftii_002673 [Candidatus Nitrospira kreftii]|uniref:Uncharacterized protein n=1 Tax=Candidatus Nitrospira kreftii TaxID=2652173 RepID=A0A7S8FFL4_9BACT|nr:MAG: hypothetical protein Nkreftii_002673 [Candidatus Nitrospira kreftii]